MALNPFEQLRHFVPEPRAAFEEIVGILLLDHGMTDGRIRVHFGDGGVDSYRGTFGAQGELTVYQQKYFPEQWEQSQKQQIKSSFETANNGRLFNLKEWYLCVPARPTKEDVRWFDSWRLQAGAGKINLLDGDDLTKMLESPQGARARQKLRDWGVVSVRDGFASLQFSMTCCACNPRSGLTFELIVSLANRGDRTAEAIKVVVEHADTFCIAVPADESFWDDRGKGRLNPRTIWAKTDLHPGDIQPVLRIPLNAQTSFPFWIKASASLRDTSSTQQSIVLNANDVIDRALFPFVAGTVEEEVSADGGFRSEPLRLPSQGSRADDLFMEIAANPDHSLFGVLYKEDVADSTKALYRPSLKSTGYNIQTDKVTLAAAIDELVELGWLYPPDRAEDMDSYRLSDRARDDDVFVYNVEELARRRL